MLFGSLIRTYVLYLDTAKKRNKQVLLAADHGTGHTIMSFLKPVRQDKQVKPVRQDKQAVRDCRELMSCNYVLVTIT